jgi:hypothetical protein
MGILLATFMNVLVITDHVSFASGHESFIRGVMYLHESKSNERVHSCFFENGTRIEVVMDSVVKMSCKLKNI